MIPELNAMYPGDELNILAYPMLKQIIQTEHGNIRGVLKFKDSLVYANTQYNSNQLPTNSGDAAFFECYRGGSRVSEFSNGEIAAHSTAMWQNHFSTSSGDVDDGKMFNYEVRSGQTAKPVFMSVDLETPLGFSSFLANSANHRKVFIPSTFNMSKILKSVASQQSVDLVCDDSFYSMELPGPLEQEYKQDCHSVSNVIVASHQRTVSSKVFSAQETVIDPLVL